MVTHSPSVPPALDLTTGVSVSSTRLGNLSQYLAQIWHLAGTRDLSLSLRLIHLLVVMGLHCRMQTFSSCGMRGLPFVTVCGLLIAAASLAVEPGSKGAHFSSCRTWTQ